MSTRSRIFTTMLAGLALAGTAFAQPQNETAALKQQVAQLNDRIDQLEKQLAEKNGAQTPVQPDEYDPFAEMNAMQSMMNRMFQQSMGDTGGMPGDFFNPRTDIKESPKEYTITMDIPGMDKSNINVKVENQNLVVSGERSSETKEDRVGKVYRHERSFGHFMRVVPLPEDAKTDGVDAQYNNGVLTVKVARGPASKPSAQKITVK